MVSKPKATPVASTSASTSTPTSVSVPTPPKPVEPTPAASVPATTSETQDPAPSASSAPSDPAPAAAPTDAPSEAPAPTIGSSFLSGEALQTTIRNMEEMGFPRDQVLRALRASYNNPDRAVEYLFNGIPDHLQAELSQPAQRAPIPPVNPTTSAPAVAPSAAPAQPQPAAPQNLFQMAQQQQQQPAGAVPHIPGAPSGLDTLRGDPRLAALGQLATQNPALLQPMIQQLAQSNPQLAQALAQNPDALLDLLGGGEGGIGDDGEPIPPGAQVLSVTPEERDAIERLEALGFPRQAVIEAYFACGKNEELAANFLFEGGFEDDDPAPQR